MRRAWILNDLFVADGYRRRGVARSLLAAARELALETQACELTLMTAKDNLPAQALYRAMGWKQDEEFLTFALEP
jgi:ribosomal protein S18 acetylase RimI-like enzyme